MMQMADSNLLQIIHVFNTRLAALSNDPKIQTLDLRNFLIRFWTTVKRELYGKSEWAAMRYLCGRLFLALWLLLLTFIAVYAKLQVRHAAPHTLCSMSLV